MPERPASAAPTRSPCCPSTRRSACRTQFARRIARNTQAVLHGRVDLARVIDPAGGSWYVERLTDELAHAAWDWFQRIERAGGQQAALGRGLVAGTGSRQNWAERSADLAHRREPITGVSEFPNLGERPVGARAGPGPARRRPAAGAPGRGVRGAAGPVRRAAWPPPARGRRCCSPRSARRAAHTARSSFAANLFQAGGIETPLSEAAAAARPSNRTCRP